LNLFKPLISDNTPLVKIFSYPLAAFNFGSTSFINYKAAYSYPSISAFSASTTVFLAITSSFYFSASLLLLNTSLIRA